MTVVVNVLLNALLIGALVLFFGSLIWFTLRRPNSWERLMITLALFCGAMVVVGSQAAGASYAQFTINAMGSTSAGGALAKAAAVAVPGSVGIGLGWYLRRCMRRADTYAIRVLAFVGMLAVAQFAAIYVASLDKKGVKLGATAIPNISFILGLLLYLVFKHDVSKQTTTKRAAWRNRLADVIAGNRTEASASTDAQTDPQDKLVARLRGLDRKPRAPSG
jgi:hypothetical protein